MKLLIVFLMMCCTVLFAETKREGVSMDDVLNNYFRNKAAQSFNQCWDIIEKKDKDDQDYITLIEKAHESFNYWKEFKDHTPTNISIGLWMLSRAYTIAGEYSMAEKYANQCISLSGEIDTFYLAYAYEALARVKVLSNDYDEGRMYINLAKEVVKESKEKDVSWLFKDLEDIEKLIRD